jgi:hypothetical protein
MRDNEKDTNKKDPLSQLIDNNPCGLCRAMGEPICRGHGGGGGGGGGSSGGSNESGGSSNESNKSPPIHAGSASESVVNSSPSTVDYASMVQQPQLNNKAIFNVDAIAELLSKKILLIDDNKELGILTIKCNPHLINLMSDDQKIELTKFIQAIKKELNDFKNKNGLSDISCSAAIEKDSKDNILSLTIRIKDPKIYDAFIHQLANKNLLSIPDTEKQNKVHQQEKSTSQKKSLPTPFSSMKAPKPKGWDS